MYFSSFLRKSSFPLATLVLFLPLSGIAGVIDCGRLENHFGPFDYRTTSPDTLALVEKHHFTTKVESLRGGNTSMTPGGDMGYTLKVFPNHHRALMAAMRYAEKTKADPPPELFYSVGCWFDRAERFRPDDGVVQALYGTYLIRKGNTKEGMERLEYAIELGGENANIYYILGLAYFDAKKYDQALEKAHRAYQLGFALPGLKDKLKKVGKWQEPVPIAPDQTPPAPPSASESTGGKPE